MIISIIILLLYLNLSFSKKKKFNVFNTQRLNINNIKQHFYDFFVLLFFLLFYIIIFRIVKIFLSVKIINLNIMFLNLNNIIYYFFHKINFIILIIFILVLIKSLILIRNLIIQNLKLSFIRLNYYYSNKSEKYFSYYINVISWQSFFWYWLTVTKLKLHKKKNGIFFSKNNMIILNIIFYFFKYIGISILIISTIIDILFHNNNLIFLSNILPFFGLYQTLYLINFFFNNKLRPRYDSYCISYIYSNKNIDYKIIIEMSQYLEKIIKI